MSTEYEITPEGVGLELLTLNAIRLGLESIERRPRQAGRPDLMGSIRKGDLTWRDSDTGPVFTWNGKEYAVDLAVIPLKTERN